ncbi:MAG: PAS domain S-box protein, partial [Eubacteriales bacterium]|nr:PAS domain S-box protein [Eubacteriales bacterium]
MNIPSEPQDFLFKQCEALKRVVSELRSRLAVADQELSRRNIELDRLNAAFQVKTEELAASEERFKSLVMTIPDIVYRLDRQGNFVWVTSNVQTLGYAPDNLAGRHFSEIVYPDDLFTVSRFDMLQQYRGHKTGCSHAAKLFDERRTGGRGTRGLEIRLMCAGPDPIESGPISDFSQSIVRVEINSAGIYDAGGIYSGTFGVMRVVSERKAMEKALAESRRRLQILLDHTEAGIMLIDERSRTIADVNAAAEKMIGALRKDLIGRECYGFVCALERGQCPILDLGQTLDNRVSVLIHSGKTEIPILKTAVRVEFDNQPYLFESFLDISALKRTDSELRKARIELEAGVAKRTAELLKINRKLEEKVSAHVQANSELEKILREMKQSREKIIHSENMTAVGVLAAGVAHELTNPMMGILNYIQYCLNKMNPDERLFGVLKDAEQEVGRCVQIVG